MKIKNQTKMLEHLKIVKILDILKKVQVETTANLYLKNDIFIGEDLLCNYISWNGYEERFSLHILHNEHIDDLYGTNFDFNCIYIDAYMEDEALKGKWVWFIKNEDGRIETKELAPVYDNFLEIILEEISKTEYVEWIDELTTFQRDRLRIIRMCHQEKKFTWEDKISHKEQNVKIDWLLYRRKYKPEIDSLAEMKELGEVAYTEKYRKQNKRIDDMANEILNEIKNEENKLK